MTFPIDEVYTLDPQDPNDPVWAADADIAEMQSTDDVNDEGAEPIRTSSGTLDFINNIVDALDGDYDTENPIRSKTSKLPTVETKEMGSDKWRAQRWTVIDRPTKILTESKQRRAVTLLNIGTQTVYLSSLPAVADGPNTVPLFPSSATFYAPLILETMDDFFGVCAAGQTSSVCVIEEFDL